MLRIFDLLISLFYTSSLAGQEITLIFLKRPQLGSISLKSHLARFISLTSNKPKASLTTSLSPIIYRAKAIKILKAQPSYNNLNPSPNPNSQLYIFNLTTPKSQQLHEHTLLTQEVYLMTLKFALGVLIPLHQKMCQQ